MLEYNCFVREKSEKTKSKHCILQIISVIVCGVCPEKGLREIDSFIYGIERHIFLWAIHHTQRTPRHTLWSHGDDINR